MTRDTHTCCRAFAIGALTTWFYDRLSQPGIEHRSAEDAYVFAKQNQVPIFNQYYINLFTTMMKKAWKN